MSSYKRRQDETANQKVTQLGNKKSSHDNNSIKKLIHKYERMESSEEKPGPSQANNAEHPTIAAKKKSMNLITAVESQNPPVSETKASLNLPARSNKTFHKPYESIIHSKGSRLYNSRGTGSKPTKPRISKPQIPDTWGQDPTEFSANDKTAVRSTLRDHPYTPVKKKNLPTQRRKVLEDGIKPQKDTIELPSAFNNEIRISPEEEFNKLNEVKANETRREVRASCLVDKRNSVSNEDKQTVKMLSSLSDTAELKRQTNTDAIDAIDVIKNCESRDLSNDESAVLAHTYIHGNVSQCPSNRSNKHLLPEGSDQPPPQEITNIMSSLELMFLQDKEVNPKTRPSKAEDLFVPEYSKPPDSSFNKSIMSTGSSNPSEMSEVRLIVSRNDMTHEEGAMTDEVTKFNLQVLSSAACSVLEYLAEPLRDLSDQLVSSQNENEVGMKNDVASRSSERGSVLSRSRDLLIKDMSTSFASNLSIKKSSNKSSKLVLVSTNSASIKKSDISIEGNESPSFLPTSLIPVSQKDESEKVEVSSSEVELMMTNNLAEEVQTVIDTNSLKLRQKVPQFGTWQHTSYCFAFPNPAIIATQFSVLKLDSPIPLIFCDNVINKSLQIFPSSLLSHFFIATTSTSLYNPSDRKTENNLSLSNLLSTIVGQAIGTSGLIIPTAISNLLWSGSGKISADIRDTIIAISSLTEDFIRLEMHLHKSNPPSVILSLIDTMYEIIPQNPDNFQKTSIESFEEDILVDRAIWMEADRPIAPFFKTFKSWVYRVHQTAELTTPAVWTIPQLLGSSDWISSELRTMTSMLIEAEIDILWSIPHLNLTEKLLHLVKTKPTASVIDQQYQLECEYGIFLIHNAVNPTLALLLGRRLAQFFNFMT